MVLVVAAELLLVLRRAESRAAPGFIDEHDVLHEREEHRCSYAPDACADVDSSRSPCGLRNVEGADCGGNGREFGDEG